jgi:hypothetical protein
MLAKRGLAIVSVVSCVALAGCESWVNKHVEPEMPAPKTSAGGVDDPAIRFVGGVPKAIDYAEAWRATYYKAVQESEYLKSATALSLIPISATALFLGVTSELGGNSDVIAALGIGGASIFTAANYLSVPTANQIYLAGSKAMGCVVLSSRPLLVPAEKFAALETALKAIAKTIATVESRVTEVKYLRVAFAEEVNQDAALVASTEVALEQATTGLKRASEARRKGQIYRAELRSSHVAIRSIILNIRDEVSKQLDSRLPTLQSLAQVVGGIGTLAPSVSQTQRFAALRGTFAGTSDAGISDSVANLTESAPADAAAEVMKKKKKKIVADSVAALEAEIETLASLITTIADVLDEANAVAGVITKLEACAVDQVPGTFDVAPNVTEITIAAGESATFSAMGGSGNYGATINGVAESYLGIVKKAPSAGFGISFVVTAKSNAKDGEAEIVIRDSSLGSNKRSVKIITKAALPDLAPVVMGLKTVSFKYNGGDFKVTDASLVEGERVVLITLAVSSPTTAAVTEQQLVAAIEKQENATEKKFRIKIKNFTELKEKLKQKPKGALDAGAVFKAIGDDGGQTAQKRREALQVALCLTDKNPVDGKDDTDGGWGRKTAKAVRLYQMISKANKTDGTLTTAQRDALFAQDKSQLDIRCAETRKMISQAFVDEVSGFARGVDDIANVVIAVSDGMVAAADPGKVEMTLAATGGAAATTNFSDAKVIEKIKKALLTSAKADDYWVGPKQMTITTKTGP